MNTNNQKSTTNKEVEKIKQARKESDSLLKTLVDEKIQSTNGLLTTQVISGASTSYVASAESEWIARNIKLFTQMPSARNIISEQEDGSVKMEWNEVTSEEMKQRMPDFTRAYTLAVYLMTQPERQFPPILTVVEPDWVLLDKEDPNYDDYWDDEGRAKQASITPDFVLSDKFNSYVINKDKLKSSYVVDGSHRLIALQAIDDACSTQTLVTRKKSGAPSLTYTFENLASKLGVEIESLKHNEVMKESFGVQFFSAVEEGETKEEANKRIRSLFIHVNKTAKNPSAGENVLLDEDSGYAIIARRVAVTHSFFKNRKPADLVEVKRSSLAPNTPKIATLSGLADVSADYLNQKFPWETSTRKQIGMRPDDQELKIAQNLLKEYYDELLQIKIFQEINESVNAEDVIPNARAFKIENDPETINNLGHLLLRPLGQRILARAVGDLVNNDGFRLADIFQKINDFEKNDGFCHINVPESCWYGLVYNPSNKKMEMKNKDLATNLLLYLLGGNPPDLQELKKGYQEARTIEDVNGVRNLNSDGNKVNSKEDILLPTKI